MKVLKIGLVVLVVLVVLTVGVTVYLVNNIDSIVKNVVESEGPKLTQTEVSVRDVDIALREGRGELSGFTVANPRDFDTPNAVKAEQLVVDIEPRSITSDVLVINEIIVKGITVTAEQKGLTTNLQTLLQSLQQASGDREAATEESDVRLMVEQVRFAEGIVNLVTESYGEYAVELPAFDVSDLGTREQGLTPAQLGRAILQPLIKQARQKAQDRVEALARERAEGELRDRAQRSLGENAEEKIDRLRSIFN
jgi:hypothetical protein